jgi:hypothetical protein
MNERLDDLLQVINERGEAFSEALREGMRLIELLCATLPTETEQYQRKLIGEFVDFFLGTKEENEKDSTIFRILGVSREKLIDDFFNSRK